MNFFNFSDQTFSLVLVLNLSKGKSQPGCSYKVCSYIKKRRVYDYFTVTSYWFTVFKHNIC